MDLFHNISLLYSFVSTSLVHAKYEDFRGPTNGLELQRLSETRWVCHNVRVNLQSIIDTLNYFADSSANVDANRRSEARGLLSFMDTCFVAELCILEETDSLKRRVPELTDSAMYLVSSSNARDSFIFASCLQVFGLACE